MKKIETEVCSECENEIDVLWDVEKDGYEITCPHCGGKSCINCDWTKENGCYRNPKNKGEQK